MMHTRKPGGDELIEVFRGRSLVVVPLMLLLAACTADPTAREAGEAVDQPLEIAVPASPVTGEVPADLMNAIIEDLVKNQDLKSVDISVVRAEFVIWPDGSLGCAQPGVMYTQARVDGYWVVLKADDQEYDYRATARGQFWQCRNLFKKVKPIG